MPKAAPRRKPNPKAKKPAALKPRVKAAEPIGNRGHYLSTPRAAGVRVNEETALTLGAVWACCKVISEDIAGLPWHVFEKLSNGGNAERDEDPADWIISTQASPEMPAFQFRESLLSHALIWGNGYAEIERDGAGRPLWMWLITPDRVTPQRAPDGRVVYEVRNPTGPPTILNAEDMFHLRGLGFDGLVGYSVVQFAARSIGTGISLDQSTSDFFGNDSTPGGVLKHPGRLSEPARLNLRESWNRMHQGPGKHRKVAILEEGMDWQQTGIPPEDTKLIEQRQFTPADICRWFRVSPVKIQDLLRATFSNIEELAIWHVTDTLMPWVRRLETEANIKLFGRTNMGKRFTKINLSALLRGDQAARWAAYKDGLGSGVWSINDVLEMEDRNPIGPDGDKRLVPVNMQLLDKVGEEPPKPAQPPGKPGQPGANPSDPNANPSQPDAKPSEPKPALSGAFHPIFEDAFRRLLRQEAHRSSTALTKKNGEFGAWLAKIETEHLGYVRDIFRPAVESLAIANGHGVEILEAALAVVAAKHLEDFKARVVLAASNPTAPVEWETLSGGLATDLIAQLVAALETVK